MPFVIRFEQHYQTTLVCQVSVWIVTVSHWPFSIQQVAMGINFIYCRLKRRISLRSSHMSITACIIVTVVPYMQHCDYHCCYASHSFHIDHLHYCYSSACSIVNIITITQAIEDS